MQARTLLTIALTAGALAGPARMGVAFAAATSPDPAAAPTQPTAASAAPDKLVVYFESGSAAIRTTDLAVLDQASRLYRDGKPIVMIVAGSSDAVGPADVNLRLSATRAEAVVRGLVARGIPAERFQLLAKGQTDPAQAAPKGVAEPANRRVEISWR